MTPRYLATRKSARGLWPWGIYDAAFERFIEVERLTLGGPRGSRPLGTPVPRSSRQRGSMVGSKQIGPRVPGSRLSKTPVPDDSGYVADFAGAGDAEAVIETLCGPRAPRVRLLWCGVPMTSRMQKLVLDCWYD